MVSKDFRAPLFGSIIISIFVSHAAQSDIDCLLSVKASLRDPSNYLTSWNFSKGDQTSICAFVGVTCWHPDENKVLNIELPGMGLKGTFPSGFVKCTSMTGLDLSNNSLRGPIPDNISHLIPFVTSLDLSYNQFCKEIPEDLGKFKFLNTIELNNNNLTGPIPPQILKMGRLTLLDVSNNHLSGSIPFANKTKTTFRYANNSGLCGGPHLPRCHKKN